MDESLRQAVLGAGNITAPASNLGASQAPELAALHAVDFQLPVSSSAAGALAGQASEQVAAQKAAAAAAKKKEQDLANISSYKIVKKDDGGYDFFDPDGNQVDIATLTKRTGVKASDLLEESENPIDIQYREDYKNLQDYITAIVNKDKETIDTIKSQRQELGQYEDEGGVDRLISDFKKYYKRYYTTRDEDSEAWGARPDRNIFVPRRKVAEQSYVDEEGL